MVVSAAPAHRPADGELAVLRRDRAPRQRRPPGDRPPRRGQPDDRRPRDQPHRGTPPPARPSLHGAQLWLALPDGDRQVEPAFEHYAAPPGARRRLGGAGLPRLLLGVDLPGDDVHPAARRRDHAGGGDDAGDAGRPVVRARRAGRHRRAHARRQAAEAVASSASSSPVGPTGWCYRASEDDPAAAARRHAVGRADRHVVELRRPRPRRGRGVPARSGRRSSPARTRTGSRCPTTTATPRSRRRSCPAGCGYAARVRRGPGLSPRGTRLGA